MDVEQTNEEGIVDKDGSTPLHRLMVEESQTETVESLVRSGIDVNAKNKNGETALHLAAKLGRVELCKALLDCGASPLERNNKNRTPKSQPRVSSEVKTLLAEAEETFKERRKERDSRLWDEKMKKTQTDSAFGLRVV